jgi:hypothetical protein
MKVLIAVLLFALLSVGTVFGAEINLKWNPNTESDLAGYKVYYGFAHRVYDSNVDVADVTAYTLTGLNAGTYYISVTAYDTSGNESDLSYEIVKDVKVNTVTGLVFE